jgi:hypothetical protein
VTTELLMVGTINQCGPRVQTTSWFPMHYSPLMVRQCVNVCSKLHKRVEIASMFIRSPLHYAGVRLRNLQNAII